MYSVEWDQHKRQIYGVIYGKEPDANDIRTVHAGDIPYADCWCFGAPCQDFSLAGLREGLDGSRSSLVREVFRLLREKEPEDRPEWIIYENVKGMLSSNKGWDFGSILAEMDDLGYDCEWNLLNSKNFGVPQNRERVYTIGHLRARGSDARKIFPIRESNQSIGQFERHKDRGTSATDRQTDRQALMPMQYANTISGKGYSRITLGVYPMGDKILRCNGYHKK